LQSNRINNSIISILSKRRDSGKAHDRLCKKYAGKPVVTIGYGPDFAVLRSKAVKMNIPQMVKELMEEIPNGGVSCGGHLVVGSIKFVGGMRKDVLAKLAEKIAACGVDAVPAPKSGKTTGPSRSSLLYLRFFRMLPFSGFLQRHQNSRTAVSLQVLPV
jgi:hypothetical protein